MYERFADFTIGGYILNKERAELFAASNPYLQASLGFCFREINAYTPLARLTAPFRYRIWWTICGFLAISTTVILLSKKLSKELRHFFIGGQTNRTPILNMWSSFLGNSIANPKMISGEYFGNFARTIFILWIILWFVIRSSYQGALYTYLQKHRLTSPYDTVDKIRESDCKIMSPLSSFNSIRHIFEPDR